MAGENGTGPRKRNNPVKKTPPVVFYLGGELHRRLHVNRALDIVTMWNYPKHCRVQGVWSQTRRAMKPALKTSEVAKLLNRSYFTLKHAMMNGFLRRPYQSYPLDGGKRKLYFWSIEDVMEAHEWFSTRSRGPLRADGLYTPQPTPTKQEILAMLEGGVTTYIQNEKGEYIPTYKEVLW